jgi:AraC-like DNA-binding protein
MKAIFLSLVLLLPSLAVAQYDTQLQKDSLRNTIATVEGADKLSAYRLLTLLYFPESIRDDLKMDTLLALFKEYDGEALRQKDYNSQGIIRVNTVSAYLNRNEHDEIFKLAPEYLACLAKREVWQHYYSVYLVLLQAHLRKGEYDKTIEGAQQMYDKAKLRGHNDGKGMALYIMSSVYGKMNRLEEEEKYIRESIEIIKNISELLGFTAQAYSRLCNVLLLTKQYDEVLLQAREFEKINYLYEETSKSKQPTTWANLWSVYKSLYFRTGDFDKAEIYCNKLDSMDCAPFVRHEVLKTRAQIYYERKQYDKALAMADKAMELCAGDPDHIKAIMGIRIMILCSMRGADDIHDLFRQSLCLHDSIRNTEMNAQLDELRTVYEVDKITAEKERVRNYLLFALGGCFLLSIALGIRIYYNRMIVRKNRGLYRQIMEQDRLAEELENEREKNRELHLRLRSDSAAPEENEDNLELFFGKLSLLMKEKRLFTNSEIKRKEIAMLIGISDRGLHDCIKDNSGMSFTEYVNSLRLAYSRELLSNRDENLTIDAIAFESGFNSRTTFYRLFNESYGLSPKQFKRLVK